VEDGKRHLSEDGGDDGAEEGAAVDGEVEDGEEGLQLQSLLRQLELVTFTAEDGHIIQKYKCVLTYKKCSGNGTVRIPPKAATQGLMPPVPRAIRKRPRNVNSLSMSNVTCTSLKRHI
jgi:hypothetical protein